MNKQLLIGYSFSKLFFGLFLIWYGFNLLNAEKMNNNTKYLPKAFDFLDVIIKSKGEFDLFKTALNAESISVHSKEIVSFIALLLIAGGFFAACGYGLSRIFIVFGLFLDLLFVHNFSYYQEEQMKINVLKIISLLGASFFIV